VQHALEHFTEERERRATVGDLAAGNGGEEGFDIAVGQQADRGTAQRREQERRAQAVGEVQRRHVRGSVRGADREALGERAGGDHDLRHRVRDELGAAGRAGSRCHIGDPRRQPRRGIERRAPRGKHEVERPDGACGIGNDPDLGDRQRPRRIDDWMRATRRHGDGLGPQSLEDRRVLVRGEAGRQRRERGRRRHDGERRRGRLSVDGGPRDDVAAPESPRVELRRRRIHAPDELAGRHCAPAPGGQRRRRRRALGAGDPGPDHRVRVGGGRHRGVRWTRRSGVRQWRRAL
jgi:hypothetical protein